MSSYLDIMALMLLGIECWYFGGSESQLNVISMENEQETERGKYYVTISIDGYLSKPNAACPLWTLQKSVGTIDNLKWHQYHSLVFLLIAAAFQCQPIHLDFIGSHKYILKNCLWWISLWMRTSYGTLIFLLKYNCSWYLIIFAI